MTIMILNTWGAQGRQRNYDISADQRYCYV